MGRRHYIPLLWSLTAVLAVSAVAGMLWTGAPIVLATGLAPADTGVRQAAAAPSAAMAASTLADAPAKRVTDAKTRKAIAHVATLAQRYRYLDDVSVVFDETPNGEEAVAYYTLGEIVIDTNHTVGMEKILAHEIWHVIDYRDNGRLDWGEDLPPANSADYLK